MSSYGTKVTNDPSASDIQEAVGTVTSDSLAAESLKGDGHFAEGNPKAAASSQKSAGSTANNRDTSGATTLDAAPDAEAREAQEEWSETSQLNAGRGLGKDAGRGPSYNTPADDARNNSGTGTGEYNTTTGGSGGVDQAPTGGYAGSAELGRDQGEFKPHGKNITEGGFDSGAPNASFHQEIGGSKDPGRLAEAKFENQNAQSGYDGGSGPRQSEVTGEGQYNTLRREEDA
ncbi:uncharacterized protein BDZ99DRAFT_493202 [Mytilinidion resinicola]|uniref:Uncharacterized protein n=1 Tax=Mytilinidion resinicola TaxID=574789 RepID=A0A6A6Z8L7_9PEZI|nr:uncharacterized protein BDZ99DRAFT_493202 [Mytilinidion resinicola]KAF2817370.1 hypothetical protein BDZ99DRAFT_493202 [Mytilinidion resinicola]